MKTRVSSRLATILGSKTATDAPYGYHGVSQNNLLPLQPRRPLSPEEELEISERKRAPLPKIFKSDADPISADIYSPALPMAAAGTLGGAGGYLLGSIAGALSQKDGSAEAQETGARVGGVSGALIGLLGGAMVGKFKRDAGNKSLEEAMRRNPEGATRRDLKSDPLRNREEMLRLAKMGYNVNFSAV